MRADGQQARLGRRRQPDQAVERGRRPALGRRRQAADRRDEGRLRAPSSARPSSSGRLAADRRPRWPTTRRRWPTPKPRSSARLADGHRDADGPRKPPPRRWPRSKKPSKRRPTPRRPPTRSWPPPSEAAKAAADKPRPKPRPPPKKTPATPSWPRPTKKPPRAAAEEADKKVKEAEKKVADAAAALAKATQEPTTAEAGNMAADQAAQAAVAAVKKAVTDVPLAEQALKNCRSRAGQVASRDGSRQASGRRRRQAGPLAGLFGRRHATGQRRRQSTGAHSGTATTARRSKRSTATAAPALAAVYLPDGGILSGGADNRAILWNPAPGWALERTIGNVDDPATFVDRVICPGLQPRRHAAGHRRRRALAQRRVEDLRTWPTARWCAQSPDAHSDTIFGLKFSPDDKYLASSAADRFVKVFNVATARWSESSRGTRTTCWTWPGNGTARCWPVAARTT